ncbi:transposable element Tcb1 transposase [Trichonephila clavipes]|nr:transposable element Tcb1 transposase [Trichonephila clavipes]
MTDRAAASRTIAHTIQSVTHHLVSARTIRRHLQQSGMPARRPLLRLPLTGTRMRSRRQWCDERWILTKEWNDIVFTDEFRFCQQHHDGRIRFWRLCGERLLNSCVMHHHAGPATGIIVWGWYWISLPHPSSTHCRYTEQSTLHICGVGACGPPIHSALVIS